MKEGAIIEYLVLISVEIIRGDDIPTPRFEIIPFRVFAETGDEAIERAKQEVAQTNRAIDTLIIKEMAATPWDNMPMLYAQSV